MLNSCEMRKWGEFSDCEYVKYNLNALYSADLAEVRCLCFKKKKKKFNFLFVLCLQSVVGVVQVEMAPDEEILIDSV